MERGSDKHGSKVDEQLARETSGHVQGGHSPRTEEWREPEPAGEDQPPAAQIPESEAVGGTPPGMSGEDVAERSELARALSPSVFPAKRGALLASAADNQASDVLVNRLRALPDHRRFANVAEVQAALGGGNEDDGQRF